MGPAPGDLELLAWTRTAVGPLQPMGVVGGLGQGQEQAIAPRICPQIAALPSPQRLEGSGIQALGPVGLLRQSSASLC